MNVGLNIKNGVATGGLGAIDANNGRGTPGGHGGDIGIVCNQDKGTSKIVNSFLISNFDVSGGKGGKNYMEIAEDGSSGKAGFTTNVIKGKSTYENVYAIQKSEKPYEEAIEIPRVDFTNSYYEENSQKRKIGDGFISPLDATTLQSQEFVDTLIENSKAYNNGVLDIEGVSAKSWELPTPIGYPILKENPVVAPTQYKVTYDLSGGTGTVLPPEILVDADGTITKPEVKISKYGYVFTGNWLKEDGTIWNFDTETVTSDVVLYAQWQAENTNSNNNEESNNSNSNLENSNAQGAGEIGNQETSKNLPSTGNGSLLLIAGTSIISGLLIMGFLRKKKFR